MQNEFPFAVRLIGFDEQEARIFETIFVGEQGRGYGYFRLLQDNLQDPDLYLVNADQPTALVILAGLRPSAIRPALLVGGTRGATAHPQVARPILWHALFEALDDLVEKRADALSKLEASDVVAVPERRRRDRLDPHGADAAVYQRMRRVPVHGDVLVLDKAPVLRDYLHEVLTPHKIAVQWVATEAAALTIFNQKKIAAVLINTSTPEVDPYRLCAALRQRNAVEKIAVIFLIGSQYPFDPERARTAGYDGFLNKPLAYHHLLSALKKFLPLSR